MHRIIIHMSNGGKVAFTGKYRRDLEKPNWHYYEDDDGDLHHFRKEHMVMVSDVKMANDPVAISAMKAAGEYPICGS